MGSVGDFRQKWAWNSSLTVMPVEAHSTITWFTDPLQPTPCWPAKGQRLTASGDGMVSSAPVNWSAPFLPVKALSSSQFAPSFLFLLAAPFTDHSRQKDTLWPWWHERSFTNVQQGRTAAHVDVETEERGTSKRVMERLLSFRSAWWCICLSAAGRCTSSTWCRPAVWTTPRRCWWWWWRHYGPERAHANNVSTKTSDGSGNGHVMSRSYCHHEAWPTSLK